MATDQSPEPNDHSESETRRILKNLEFGTVPVDKAALDSIREHARTEAASTVRLTKVTNPPGTSAARGYSRAVAALVSAAALLMLAVFVRPGRTEAAESLGEILTRFRKSPAVSRRRSQCSSRGSWLSSNTTSATASA